MPVPFMAWRAIEIHGMLIRKTRDLISHVKLIAASSEMQSMIDFKGNYKKIWSGLNKNMFTYSE